ncbi:MAG TPA: hypothetical protein VEA80_15520 [Vitreimonas sp.]|uniref:hypothetical protein n=1 Tax=Vitreimonas sp. TaxID=3069702 RepID=UPI002D23CC24|nr:hypothetical protein [Vitreimonas sp.]HYD88883.1 hypothetical protein [Vitreimonas sp.]
MRFRFAVGLVCAALTLGACASGGASGSRSDEPIRALMSADALMFVSFDTNADLITSAAEIDAGREREFTRADANSDGSLSPIEFQNWGNLVLGGGQLGPYRLDFDRNVDNTITREEFDTEIRGRVVDYDQDENGDLARSEFVRLVGQARPPRRRITPTMPPN